MSERVVARLDEVPPGKAKRVVVDGTEILLCNVADELFAVEDVCTHDGGALDQGELEGCRIRCPRHGALFDLRNGQALTLPAILPLQTFTVRVVEGQIVVDV